MYKYLKNILVLTVLLYSLKGYGKEVCNYVNGNFSYSTPQWIYPLCPSIYPGPVLYTAADKISDLLKKNKEIRYRLYYKDTSSNMLEFPYTGSSIGTNYSVDPIQFTKRFYPESALLDIEKQYFENAYRYLIYPPNKLGGEDWIKGKMEDALKAYKNLYIDFGLGEKWSMDRFAFPMATTDIDTVYSAFMDGKKAGNNYIPRCLIEQTEKNQMDPRLKYNKTSIEIFPIEVYTSKIGMFSVNYDSSREGNFYGWELSMLPRLVYTNKQVTAIGYNSKYYKVTRKVDNGDSFTYFTQKKNFTFNLAQQPVALNDNFNDLTIKFYYENTEISAIEILSKTNKQLMQIAFYYLPDETINIKKNGIRLASIGYDQNKLVQTVTDPISETTRLAYNPAHKLSAIVYPSGLKKEFQYFDKYSDVLKSTVYLDLNLGVQKYLSNISYVNLGDTKNKCEIKRTTTIRNAQGDELTNVMQFTANNAIVNVSTEMSSLYKTISKYAIDYVASNVLMNIKGYVYSLSFSELQKRSPINFNLQNQKLTGDIFGKPFELTAEDKVTRLNSMGNKYGVVYDDYNVLARMDVGGYSKSRYTRNLIYNNSFIDSVLNSSVYDNGNFEFALGFKSYSDFTLSSRDNWTAKFKLDEIRRPISVDDSAQGILTYNYFSFEKNGFNGVTITQNDKVNSHYLNVFGLPTGKLISGNFPRSSPVIPEDVIYTMDAGTKLYERKELTNLVNLRQSSNIRTQINNRMLSASIYDDPEGTGVKNILIPVAAAVVWMLIMKKMYSNAIDEERAIERSTLLIAMIPIIIATNLGAAVYDYFKVESFGMYNVAYRLIETASNLASSFFQYLEMTAAVDEKLLQALASGVAEHMTWEVANYLRYNNNADIDISKIGGSMLNGFMHGAIDGGGAYFCEKYIEDSCIMALCGFVRGALAEGVRILFQQVLSPYFFKYPAPEMSLSEAGLGVLATGITAAVSHHIYDRISSSTRTLTDINWGILANLGFAYGLPAFLPY